MENLSENKLFSIINDLESFIDEKKVTELETYKEARDFAKEFYINNLKSEDEESIETIIRELRKVKRQSSSPLFISILISDFLSDTEVVYNNVPPLEAYEYVGNNKLKVGQSKISYGLLFE